MDFNSLNVNELPTAMVCAVSPAQNRPFGLLHNERNTNTVGVSRTQQLSMSD